MTRHLNIPAPPSIEFRRPREVFRASGYSKTTYYRQVAIGLQAPFVRLGANAVAVPAHEQDAINAARAAGKTDDEIRALVAALVAARKAAD